MGTKKKRKLRQEKTFTGVVDHVKRRYCFVSSDEITDDIKIKSRDMKSAINGDKVLFKLLNNYNYKSFEGAIIKVIERSKNEFIGKIEDHNDFTPVFWHDGLRASEKKCADYVPLSGTLYGN